MLKKNNFWFGLTLGIIVPAISYFLFYFINKSAASRSGIGIQQSTVQVIAIFCNVFIFRYYINKLEFDKTGRGILLTTILFTILFFALNYKTLFENF